MTTHSDLIGSFSDYQRGRHFSPATIRRRRVALSAFQQLLAPGSLLDATADLADEFVATYRSPATKRAYRADLTAFYRWAMRRRLIESNPMDDTDPVRVPRCLPRPVDAALVEHLIATAASWNVATAIALAAYAGLRRSEICALDRNDLSLATSPAVLVVRSGKGSKDRAVPVHPTLLPIIAGRPAGRLVDCGADALGTKVATHLRERGVDATLHQLRHTFGTEAARASNGNLLIVADLMGHESVATTMGYTRLVGANTATTVASMFPAAA